jgi:hypothetical protein
MQPHLRLVIERSIAGNLASSLSRFGGALSVAVIVLCNEVPGETLCESDDKMARSRKGRGHYFVLPKGKLDSNETNSGHDYRRRGTAIAGRNPDDA